MDEGEDESMHMEGREKRYRGKKRGKIREIDKSSNE